MSLHSVVVIGSALGLREIKLSMVVLWQTMHRVFGLG